MNSRRERHRHREGQREKERISTSLLGQLYPEGKKKKTSHEYKTLNKH